MGLKDTVEDIKALKIQGAQNVAIAAISAIKKLLDDSIFKDSNDLVLKLNRARKLFFESRPTEPCMRNSINYVLDIHYSNDFNSLKRAVNLRTEEVKKHLKSVNTRINNVGYNKIKNGYRVFTHCHSGTVIGILKHAHNQGRKFEVYNTETRPLFQGRKTALELAKAGIKVHHFVDSAAKEALKKADIVLLGCDAIISIGDVINKIGSEQIVEIAEKHDIPVYICTDSWKFDPNTIQGYDEEMEERNKKEVWDIKNKNIKIHNPAFAKLGPENITGILSELGIYPPMIFVEEVKQEYPWMFESSL